MSANIKEVNDTNFDAEVLQSSQPVLVDFWAPWCGPCRTLAPTLETISEDFQGKVKVVKVNVDENVATPPNFGIKGIPTMILFAGGKEIERVVGLPPNAKQYISQLLDKHAGEIHVGAQAALENSTRG